MADVSVIIPSHNDRLHVGAAIESLLAQTDVPRQIIVVDDSDDDTAQVVGPYTRGVHSPVKLVRHTKCNVSEARNAGLEAATCGFLAFLDGDDVWLPDKTQRQLEMFDRCPEAAGVYCRHFIFQDDIDDLGRRQYQAPVVDKPEVEHVLRYQNLPASAVMVRRQLAGHLRFDERSGHGEDSIYAADVCLVGPWRLVDEALVGKRVHQGQVTISPWHRVWNAQARVRWCLEHADCLGGERADRIADEVWSSLVTYVEGRYWRRQLQDFKALRAEMAQLCPNLWSRSAVANKRVYPRWAYRLRDAIAPPRRI